MTISGVGRDSEFSGMINFNEDQPSMLEMEQQVKKMYMRNQGPS